MDNERSILGEERFQLVIDRLCQQLIERYDHFSDTCLIGIQPRGTFLSDRIHQRLLELLPGDQIDYGRLDITFYRDDFRKREKPLRANLTDIDFLVEDKKVVLIDDVLYTGRTIQASLMALSHYGRPQEVQLLVLVDRRFNRHLPIQANFVGMTVDALDQAYVKVEWKAHSGRDQILLYADKEQAE
ncbi:MAG: bifunctional pyr operon transcriptional regulator/uracil phosphoribosyltransferase PyrR [Saprospiraceae bacterium]|nr:bifunctional pyr operon transcriptional regulator/uracil phosphoribosyltransferase PyrR [Saprospiraceae bacterium]